MGSVLRMTLKNVDHRLGWCLLSWLIVAGIFLFTPGEASAQIFRPSGSKFVPKPQIATPPRPPFVPTNPLDAIQGGKNPAPLNGLDPRPKPWHDQRPGPSTTTTPGGQHPPVGTIMINTNPSAVKLPAPGSGPTIVHPGGVSSPTKPGQINLQPNQQFSPPIVRPPQILPPWKR